jgi:spoIIIJ-associated protein
MREKMPPTPRPAPRSERLERLEGDLADSVHDALEILLDFVGVEAEWDLYQNEERVEVELWGPDDHLLLEEEGALLLAIEHLLPRMLRGIHGDAMPVRVDCNEFHFEREERLRELAWKTADEVRRRGEPKTLTELDPAERRIVHITLADDEDVSTESVGGGYYTRLKVVPN